MKCAFADIRNRYTELMAARARGPIQTPKKLTAFGASAKHSKRKKLLTLASHYWQIKRGTTDGCQRFIDVW
jgi:hypothetical protein